MTGHWPSVTKFDALCLIATAGLLALGGACIAIWRAFDIDDWQATL